MHFPRLLPASMLSITILVISRLAAAQLAPTTLPASELAAAARLPWPLRWESGGVLVSPVPDKEHAIISVKDPSVVRYHDRWHVYATTADTRGHWSMVYLSFKEWSDAAAAKPYYIDANPNLRGYHCAPQVFYFTPQKKWYLIFQSQQPQYSTADDPSKPETWTPPRDFFATVPPIVDKLWLDYWIICDQTHAYLFFTGDNGHFYRSRTTLERFPEGMSDPVVVMREPQRFDLFEGSATYRLKGAGKYLTLIEALGPQGIRYYRGFLADRLDGDWMPLADTWDNPFAGMNNVTFEPGVRPWTKDISHGELLRDGYDETMTVDPANLQFLYQGRDPERDTKEYSQLPYRLGLLHLRKHEK